MVCDDVGHKSKIQQPKISCYIQHIIEGLHRNARAGKIAATRQQHVDMKDMCLLSDVSRIMSLNLVVGVVVIMIVLMIMFMFYVLCFVYVLFL